MVSGKSCQTLPQTFINFFVHIKKSRVQLRTMSEESRFAGLSACSVLSKGPVTLRRIAPTYAT